jgi:hypothetical protein
MQHMPFYIVNSFENNWAHGKIRMQRNKSAYVARVAMPALSRGRHNSFSIKLRFNFTKIMRYHAQSSTISKRGSNRNWMGNCK